MRITRIDFEGHHELDGQAGHWYVIVQRRDNMHNGPDFVEVTITTPDSPNGIKYNFDADSEGDIASMARFLQHRLDGYEGSNSEIQEYYLELLRLSNC